eukprot:3192441-Rhodomonas_salina.1
MEHRMPHATTGHRVALRRLLGCSTGASCGLRPPRRHYRCGCRYALVAAYPGSVPASAQRMRRMLG